jgi:MYXO-CTERM domain-containing protein
MRKLITAAVLSLPLLASAAPTNLVVNGDFEANVLGNGTWSNFSTITGWTRVAGPGTGFEVRNNVSGAAYSGKNFIELDTNGNTTIEQLFNSLVPSAAYKLSFAYSPRPGVAAASNGINVFWNGQQLAPTMTATGGGQHSWTVFSTDVYAAAGPNSLRFASVGTSDSLGGSLDAVGLTVPEPGALALAAFALAGVWSVRRRQA